MVGVVELGEGVVVGRAFHPLVENLDLLKRLRVVVDDHPLAPHDDHLAHLVGVEPAAVDGGDAAVGKIDGHVRHVLDTLRHVRLPLAVHRHGGQVEEVEDDGYAVGGEIPGGIDVPLEEAQVEPPGGDVENLPDISRIDDLLDPANGRRVDEGVPHHEGQVLLCGESVHLVALRRRHGHRFFHEGVFARF